MAKLQPPYLEGTIPAFYGDSITVPFAMNRAVGKSEVRGFSLLIKSIQTGQRIEDQSSTVYSIEDGTVTFSGLNQSNYKIGQSYKIQIAYIDKNYNEVGHYSTVAIVKYTSAKFSIKLEDLEIGKLNEHKYSYTGVYQTEDVTEKMYSCQFKVYDRHMNLLKNTEEIIHNSLNDLPPQKIGGKNQYTASEVFDFNEELDPGDNYHIQFFVKTIGLMELESPVYTIVQGQPIPLKSGLSIDSILSYDNGYISVNFKSNGSIYLSGQYVLSRASSKDNFKSWNEIMRFTLNEELNKEIWRDFTIEHGVSYQYGIFMIDNDNHFSSKVISNIVMADFEDMFLFDGDRQLKIQFNPKVSSIKNVRLEQKTDTIGGKYPYIFRNGHVDYKEFSIAGLISHLTDSDGYFEKSLAQMKYNETGSQSIGGIYSTGLNTENFIMEKEFKFNVLNWLTNGQPKLFRSPAEGNYIVRLVNVSLTPTDSLSRMLHSFTSTAYEIKEYTHKNLIDTKIIKDNLLIGIDLKKFEKPTSKTNIPMSEFNTYFQNNNIISASRLTFHISSGSYQITINGTDSGYRFIVPTDLNIINMPITSMSCSKISTDSQGTFDIECQSYTIPPINENITSVDTIDVPIIQFLGIRDMYYRSESNLSDRGKVNLFSRFLADPDNREKNKEYVSQLFSIKATRRKIIMSQLLDDSDTNWNNLKVRKSENTMITIVPENLYVVYNTKDELIGYLDNGRQILRTEWPELFTNVSDQDKYWLQFVNYKDQNIYKEVPVGSSLQIDTSIMDFTEYKSLFGSIFIIVEFCCRLGSKNITNPSQGTATYNSEVQKFKNNSYEDQSQSGLENLLNNIAQSFWKEGIVI